MEWQAYVIRRSLRSSETDYAGQSAEEAGVNLSVPKTEAPTKFDTNAIQTYAEELKKRGRTQETIKNTTERLTRLTQLCDINDPEQVRLKLSEVTWKNSTKQDLIEKYTGFLKFYGCQWNAPKYKRESTIYYIPTEKEIDSLIASGSPKTATVMQFLKETGARIGEVMKTKWIDINQEQRRVYIHSEKGSNDRILPISEKLLAMLNHMKKINENVFQPTKHGYRVTFESLRKRTAQKLNNPKLMRIHLHTFRHYKGTMEYHKTRDIYYVKTILGHKTVKSTEVYVNIEKSYYLNDSDEWTCKTATNIEEGKALVESGFEYITEIDGTKLFRKRK